MANNNAIYNAVIIGAGGSSQTRWLQSPNYETYESLRTTVEAIATTVDAAIEAGSIDTQQQLLMQSICQGVFSNRYPQGDDFGDIADAIVALYTSLNEALLSVGGGGGGIVARTAMINFSHTNGLQRFVINVADIPDGTQIWVSLNGVTNPEFQKVGVQGGYVTAENEVAIIAEYNGEETSVLVPIIIFFKQP